MGEAKQLLKLNGKSLLNMAIEKALALKIPTVVVLGANYQEIQPTIESQSVIVSINHDWQKGMSTSIKNGVESALKQVPKANGILLTLADQPAITTNHLASLLIRGISENKVVATQYGGSPGVPSYFPERYFDQLKRLSGDQGAKPLFSQPGPDVVQIHFEEASQDIDTRQDWISFVRANEGIDNSAF